MLLLLLLFFGLDMNVKYCTHRLGLYHHRHIANKPVTNPHALPSFLHGNVFVVVVLQVQELLRDLDRRIRLCEEDPAGIDRSRMASWLSNVVAADERQSALAPVPAAAASAAVRIPGAAAAAAAAPATARAGPPGGGGGGQETNPAVAGGERGGSFSVVAAARGVTAAPADSTPDGFSSTAADVPGTATTAAAAAAAVAVAAPWSVSALPPVGGAEGASAERAAQQLPAAVATGGTQSDTAGCTRRRFHPPRLRAGGTTAGDRRGSGPRPPRCTRRRFRRRKRGSLKRRPARMPFRTATSRNLCHAPASKRRMGGPVL